MSRGQRLYQEDAVCAKVLNLPTTSSTRDSQCAYFGIFDGHGGNYVSGYLRDNLSSVIERVGVRDWNLIDYFRVYGEQRDVFMCHRLTYMSPGNYFPNDADTHPMEEISLSDRLKLAFLKVCIQSRQSR